ncbi:hypothetical protein [Actinotalea sp. JY-7876]|uniref:hypothetical protein n=1 Tax=Actinotalea sp. JY-7876 TaxID=2758442 RepID=UPI0015F756F2|nr:hypothetical protein [Actinotalea sp. JY-7876]
MSPDGVDLELASEALEVAGLTLHAATAALQADDPVGAIVAARSAVRSALVAHALRGGRAPLTEVGASQEIQDLVLRAVASGDPVGELSGQFDDAVTAAGIDRLATAWAVDVAAAVLDVEGA